jgi:chromate transport protein ChrA
VATALKLAVLALLLALVITILWGAYAHPGELFGTLAFFLAANLLMTHTVACFALIGFIAFWLIVRRPDVPSRSDQAEPKLLPPPRNDST